MGSLLKPIRLPRVVLGCVGIPHVKFLNYHLIGRVISKSPQLPNQKFLSFLTKMEWVVTQISLKSSGFSPRCFIFEFFNIFFSVKATTAVNCPWRGVCGHFIRLLPVSVTKPLYTLHSSKCFEISEIPDLALEEDKHYLLLHLDFIWRKKF